MDKKSVYTIYPFVTKSPFVEHFKKMQFLSLLYVVYHMRPKCGKGKINEYITEKNDLENKAGILYNDTVDQLKGM